MPKPPASHPVLPARPSLPPTAERSRALPAAEGSRSGGSRFRAGRRLSPDVAGPRRAQAAPRGPEQRPRDGGGGAAGTARPRAARDALRQAPGRAPPGCPVPLLSARAVGRAHRSKPQILDASGPCASRVPAALGRLAPAEGSPGTGTRPRKARRGRAGGTASSFLFFFNVCILLGFCFVLFLEKGKTELVSSQQRESCWNDTAGRDPARAPRANRGEGRQAKLPAGGGTCCRGSGGAGPDCPCSCPWGCDSRTPGEAPSTAGPLQRKRERVSPGRVLHWGSPGSEPGPGSGAWNYLARSAG